MWTQFPDPYQVQAVVGERRRSSHFGTAVAFMGRSILIGAPKQRHHNGRRCYRCEEYDSGVIYRYERQYREAVRRGAPPWVYSWSSLTLSGETPIEGFGEAIASLGGKLAVASRGGTVHLMEMSDDGLVEIQMHKPEDGESPWNSDHIGFGTDGSTVVLAARHGNTAMTSNGFVYLYDFDGERLAYGQRIMTRGAGFGHGIGVWNDTVMLGSPGYYWFELGLGLPEIYGQVEVYQAELQCTAEGACFCRPDAAGALCDEAAP